MQFFKNHPKFLSVISFGILWNTFSYYGIQTVLILYLIHTFHYSINTSYSLYGAFLAFNFAMPILGGVVADKWLGCKQAIILGASFNIVGNILLMFQLHYLFSLGLATMLLGSGLYISSLAAVVGTLYKTKDPKKEKAYTIYYISTNAGGAFAPILYGAVIYFFGWHWIFLCNVIAVGWGLLFFLNNLKKFPDQKVIYPKINFKKNIITIVLLVMIIIGMALLFFFYAVISWVILGLFIAGFFYVFTVISGRSGTTKKHLSSLVFLSVFCSFYYITALQTGSTIILFIQQRINEGIIPTHLPASVFNTLYCFFVILLLPVSTITWNTLAKHNIMLSPAQKVALGILFAALALAMFAISSLGYFTIFSILLGYLFLSAGELILAPAVYTAISDLSPNDMKSTMMGTWMLFIAIGGYLSGILAKITHFVTVTFLPHIPLYFAEFSIITLFTFIVAMLAFALAPKLTDMMT